MLIVILQGILYRILYAADGPSLMVPDGGLCLGFVLKNFERLIFIEILFSSRL